MQNNINSIETFTSEDSIYSVLKIEKYEYKLLNYNNKKKELERLDIFVLLSLFDGYSFDGILRFLLANLSEESIKEIQLKKEHFNNKDKLKNSNDKKLLNLYNLVLKNIDNINFPNNFPKMDFKERLNCRLNEEEKSISKDKDVDIPQELSLFSRFLLSMEDDK